jgi:PEP-CTERM motif
MRKAFWIIVALPILGTKAPAAHADAVYTYTISGADTGTITMTVNSSAIITAVSGTFDGSTIKALLPPGSIGLNDNSYYDPPTYIFDYVGVSFSLDSDDTDGYDDVNIGYFGSTPSGTEYFSNQGTCGAAGCGTSAGHPEIYPDFLTLVPTAATPEPSALTLAGLGLLALFFAMRKRAPVGRSRAS